MNKMTMTEILPAWANPSCSNMPAAAFASGAAVSAFGLDTIFTPSLGAPPAVHWALGGVGACYYCKGSYYPDKETAMAAAYGYLGGMAVTMFMSR